MNIREQALAFATKAHKGQFRKNSKLEYITHPIAVAEIAEKLYVDYLGTDKTDDVYVAAILHDVIEDTKFTYEDIEKEFDGFIANRVKGLTRGEGESYFDMIMRISEGYFMDAIIKLADNIHNSSDLKEGSLKDKYRFSQHILRSRFET